MKVTIYFPAFGHATGLMPHYMPVDGFAVPQTILYLATAVKALGYDVDVVDGNFCLNSVKQVMRCKPDKILISSSTPAFQDTLDTIQGLRKTGYGGDIYVGGSHASLNRGVRDWLLPMQNDVHYVKTSKEQSIFHWIPEVFPGREVSELVASPSENYNARCRSNPRPKDLGQDKIFSQFTVDLGYVKKIYAPSIAWKVKHRSGRKVTLGPSLLTAIGCINKCTYCSNSMMYNTSYLDVSILESILSSWSQLGIRNIGISDMYYLQNVDHARNVSRLLKQYGISFGMQTCMESLTGDILDELSEDGCTSCFVGIENPESYTLQKEVHLENVLWLIGEALLKRKIVILLSYIVGLPGVSMVSDAMLIKHISELCRIGYPSCLIQCNLYMPYRQDELTTSMPYEGDSACNGHEDDVEYILDKIPFSYWGIFPISFGGVEDLTRRMMLCDIVSRHVYPEWASIYSSLRKRFCGSLAKWYPDLIKYIPNIGESLREYRRIVE